MRRGHFAMRTAAHIDLPYQPPFDWAFFIRYFHARSTPGVETIADGRYVRTILVNSEPGLMSIADDPRGHRLVLTLNGPAKRHAQAIVPRVRRLFDLDADIAAINAALCKDRSLRRHVRASPGLRVPGAWSAFEVLARAIVGTRTAFGALAPMAGVCSGAPLAEGSPR